MWTSPNYHAFLGVTGHFIDDSSKLREVLLDFRHLTGSHTGKNLASAFAECTKDLNIDTKVDQGEIVLHKCVS